MQVTLDVLLRLFAPYLPFVTEDVWSWWREGSVHQAPWPVSDEIVPLLGVRDAEAERALGLATDILGEIRKKKSEGQKSMRTPVIRVAITLPDDMRALLASVSLDVSASGLVQAWDVTPGDTLAVTAVELGEPPAKGPAA